MTSPATTTPILRRCYIDWARGVAVLIMIQAHALDAWTKPAARSSQAFGYLMVLGGFAAPLFLWLAGVGLALSVHRILERTGSLASAANAMARRGMEIFILAFLFRLQAFIISPGSSPVTLFRVDILNVMGPAIAIAGVVWSLTGGGRRAALACGLIATAMAMVTPIVRSAGWVGSLPIWFQWYLRPSGENTTFTLLPWAAFVFAGASYGAFLPAARDAKDERRTLAILTAVGVGLVGLGMYMASLPSIYRTSSFWTSSPTYFAVRTGVLMLVLGVCFWITPLSVWLPRTFRVLERFGRNSLFIYWIHVELVYGYTTWVIHRRLPLAGTAAAYLVFCAAMLGVIALKDRFLSMRRPGPSPNSAPNQPAAAQA